MFSAALHRFGPLKSVTTGSVAQQSWEKCRKDLLKLMCSAMVQLLELVRRRTGDRTQQRCLFPRHGQRMMLPIVRQWLHWRRDTADRMLWDCCKKYQNAAWNNDGSLTLPLSMLANEVSSETAR
eukprot:gnl/MRDRNA2_/MRDRNA2_413704_c0_seq1.p1 gnl/MRDRNA2_/MRDRNA2_413704_c0~~gnl/MRDRNA2_/MRDRNA2_413704_c0_seq1.p1  ORF type:complete len:124 (-),score=13.03 gnl/MRDRNA2_/MRDRNA2_413704_c0_seq1:867-1238(-)